VFVSTLCGIGEREPPVHFYDEDSHVQSTVSFNLEEEPMDDAWSKWVLGVVEPSLIAGYGLSRVILRHAVL
jgi:hypothetical protein